MGIGTWNWPTQKVCAYFVLILCLFCAYFLLIRRLLQVGFTSLRTASWCRVPWSWRSEAWETSARPVRRWTSSRNRNPAELEVRGPCCPWFISFQFFPHRVVGCCWKFVEISYVQMAFDGILKHSQTFSSFFKWLDPQIAFDRFWSSFVLDLHPPKILVSKNWGFPVWSPPWFQLCGDTCGPTIGAFVALLLGHSATCCACHPQRQRWRAAVSCCWRLIRWDFRGTFRGCSRAVCSSSLNVNWFTNWK